MTQQILDGLRRINHGVALLAGLILVACIVFILADVLLRQMGSSLGGTDEISGYVMAAITAWGMAYALLEMAHVRIDIVRTQLGQPGRVVLDLIAMASLAAVTLLIAAQAWPVLGRTLEIGALANTPLETPLWIPQMVWWTGWAWFAIASCVLMVCAVAMMVKRQLDEAERTVGARSEMESLS